MNRSLRISLFANLALGAALLWLIGKSGTKSAHGDAAVAPAGAETRPETVSIAPKENPDPRQEFRWSQLESTDYRTYIANLRSIGCPEQTIRDIITSDLHSAYASRCTDLERKQAAMTGRPSFADTAARQELEAELQKLRGEETSVASALLDTPASSSSGVNPSRTPRLKPADPVTPLVLQDADLAALNLTPGQVEAINNERQTYQQKMDALNAHRNDPDYRQQWQRIQSESDSLLLAILGSDDYRNYQMQLAGRSQ